MLFLALGSKPQSITTRFTPSRSPFIAALNNLSSSQLVDIEYTCLFPKLIGATPPAFRSLAGHIGVTKMRPASAAVGSEKALEVAV